MLLDGRLTLTSSIAERTVKSFVMSRKNFLFCDTAKGADASALCFSMIETAKRNGLDPFGYLLFLLQELPKLGKPPAEEPLERIFPWSNTIPVYRYLT
ncbi:MAG: transposase domain-containing protein [Faecalibacterium prausnitzii]